MNPKFMAISTYITNVTRNNIKKQQAIFFTINHLESSIMFEGILSRFFETVNTFDILLKPSFVIIDWIVKAGKRNKLILIFDISKDFAPQRSLVLSSFRTTTQNTSLPNTTSFYQTQRPQT